MAGVTIIILRNQLISIAFGKSYLIYSIIIIPLVIWMLLSVINNFLGIQYLVAVVLNVFLGLIYGIYGISIAAPIGEACLTILLFLNGKKVKEKEL